MARKERAFQMEGEAGTTNMETKESLDGQGAWDGCNGVCAGQRGGEWPPGLSSCKASCRAQEEFGLHPLGQRG